MKLQVMISTMYMRDNLLNEMNINSDVLIINQCDEVNYKKKDFKNNKVEIYSFNERGLSRSRNNALLRCTGDIVCIADDDVVYSDTYKQDILDEFDKHPEADVIIFNVSTINGPRNAKEIKTFKRVGKRESREYGSVHIAMKRDKLVMSNVYFNILFGSGAKYSSGEDTIFIKELIEHKLRVYKSPIKIAEVDMTDSTWFKGYNEKYFFDKGALIGATYPEISYFLVVLQALRNSKSKLGSYKHFFKLFRWYRSGLYEYKKSKNK